MQPKTLIAAAFGPDDRRTATLTPESLGARPKR
jgi:hypothetical protein